MDSDLRLAVDHIPVLGGCAVAVVAGNTINISATACYDISIGNVHLNGSAVSEDGGANVKTLVRFPLRVDLVLRLFRLGGVANEPNLVSVPGGALPSLRLLPVGQGAVSEVEAHARLGLKMNLARILDIVPLLHGSSRAFRDLHASSRDGICGSAVSTYYSDARENVRTYWPHRQGTRQRHQ